MVVEFESVAFASPDPERDAEFWRALLDRPVRTDDHGILVSGDGPQVGLRFVAGTARDGRPSRLHLHVSQGALDQAENIAAAVRLGGRLRGNGHVPVGDYAAMADPVGDDFCVIEDDNAYLADGGPLGEVTCEGTRTVGLFWSAVLGWPLVWEEGDETAIQAALGGTKLAWSGDAPAGYDGRQWFVVTVDDLEAEVERMTRLGASGSVAPSGDTTLVDPDGIPFVVRGR